MEQYEDENGKDDEEDTDEMDWYEEGQGDALSQESIADFTAAEQEDAQTSASPAVKPQRIANRLRMVDDGSPQQEDNALDPKEGTAEDNVQLRGAAMTIQRALRAKREAGLLEKRTFNIAAISKAAIVENREKKKLTARIAESEVQLLRL